MQQQDNLKKLYSLHSTLWLVQLGFHSVHSCIHLCFGSLILICARTSFRWGFSRGYILAGSSQFACQISHFGVVQWFLDVMLAGLCYCSLPIPQKIKYTNLLHCCYEKHVEWKGKRQHQQNRQVDQLQKVNINVEQHRYRLANMWNLLQHNQVVGPCQEESQSSNLPLP